MTFFLEQYRIFSCLSIACLNKRRLKSSDDLRRGNLLRRVVDAPQLGDDGALAGVDDLLAVAERELHRADVVDHPHEPARLDGRRLVAAEHRAVEGDVPLDHAGAERDGRHTRGESDLVAAVADRHHREEISQGLDDPQVQLFRLARVRRRAVEQHEVVLTQDVDGALDLLHRAHPRREDDRDFEGPTGAQERVVGQARRSDLDRDRVELPEELHAGLVPGRGEPVDALLAAVLVDLLVLLQAELETPLEVAVGRTEDVLSRLGELLGRVDDLDGTLLELDRGATGGLGRVDELLRVLHRPVVVDADLGGDVAGVPVADGDSSDADDLTAAHSDCLLESRLTQRLPLRVPPYNRTKCCPMSNYLKTISFYSP